MTPRYLIRDRDGIYGGDFRAFLRGSTSEVDRSRAVPGKIPTSSG